MKNRGYNGLMILPINHDPGIPKLLILNTILHEVDIPRPGPHKEVHLFLPIKGPHLFISVFLFIFQTNRTINDGLDVELG
jgi:hypothetical protein